MRLINFVSECYAPARLNLRPRSLETLRNTVRCLDRSIERPADVEELSEQLISRHLRYLVERQHSPTQIKVRRGNLITLWRFAYRKGFTANNPFVADIDNVRIPKRRPIAWSLEQINAMLTQAALVPTRDGFGPSHWEALIHLLYNTGLRITAALSLKRTNLQGHLLFVPHAIQKDDEEMLIRLPDHLVNMLVSLPTVSGFRHGRSLGQLLIPWPWSLTNPTRSFYRQIIRPAGLPHDHRLKFHAFRRTTATLVAATAGKAAAQDILGHSSIKVTEKYLADPSHIDPRLKGFLSPCDVLPALHIG